MKKMCILVNRIWEFIQHSQAFLFRKGWPSLYHSLYETLKITTERSGYKIIKSYHSLNIQQNNYAWVYPLHLLHMDLQEYIFIEIGLQHYFSSCSCDLFPFSSAPESLETVVRVLFSVGMPTCSWGCVHLLWSIALYSVSGVIPVDLPLICWSLCCPFKPTTGVL